MDLSEFESKYHFKIVKPLNNHYQLPVKEYIVTAALYNYEDDGKTTVFAIKALDYSLENKHWFAIKIADNEFDKCIADFEIIRDGAQESRPKITEEILTTYEKIEDNHWIIRFSSYLHESNYGYWKVPISEIKRNVEIGTEEYTFVFNSIFDVNKTSVYIIKLPIFETRQEVEEYIKPFRQDILDNQICYGVNRRLLK